MIRPRVKKRILAFAGLVLSLVAISLVFRAVPLEEVVAAMSEVGIWAFVAATGVAAAGIMLRGPRWALLFAPHFSLPVRRVSNYVMLGLAVNAIMPGRPGDVARLALVTQRFKTGVVFTGATLLVERLLDSLTLLIFLISSMSLAGGLDPQTSAGLLGYEISGAAVVAIAKTLVVISVSVLVVIVFLLFPAGQRLLRQFVKRLPLGVRLREMLQQRLIAELETGLSALGHASVLYRAIPYSIVIWASLALCNFAVASGIPGIDLTLGQVFVITAVSIAASSLPSAPGAWGIFEAGVLLALALLGIEVDSGVAVAFAFVAHAAQYIPVVVLGLLAAWREHVAISGAGSLIPEPRDSDP